MRVSGSSYKDIAEVLGNRSADSVSGKLEREKIYVSSIIKTQEKYVGELSERRPGYIAIEQYILARTPILHLHEECGTKYMVSPDNILRGKSCPICSNKAKSKKMTLTHEEYVIKLLDRPIYVVGKYEKSNTQLEHRCGVCTSTWKSTPASILSGYGCPTCANIKRRIHWDKDKSVKEQALLIEDYLYIMQCDSCIKVGVSNNPEKRLNQIKRESADQSWQLITTLKTNVGGAHILESKIRSEFKRFPSTSSWCGHTELHYTSDLEQIQNFIANN